LINYFKNKIFFFQNGNIISILFYILTSIISILYSIVLTKFLGPIESGKIYFSLLFLNTINIFFNFGLGQSIVFFTNNKKYNYSLVVNLAFNYTLIVSIISIPLILFFSQLFPNLFVDFPNIWLIILTLVSPFVNLKTLSEYYFASIKNYFLNTSINFFDVLFRTLFSILFYLNFNSINIFFYAIIIVTIISGISPWYFIFKKVKFVFSYKNIFLKNNMIPGYINYSLLSHFSVLLGFLTLRSDQFLVSTLLSVKDLSFYVVALIIAELPFKLSTIISKVLFSSVSSINNNNNDITNSTIRLVLLISIIISIFIILLSKYFFINFYGSDFILSYQLLILLLPGSVFFNFSQILQTHLAAKGKMKIGVLIGLFSLSSTIILNIIYTPKYGLKSVAIISSISYFLNAILSIYYYLKISTSTIKDIFGIEKNDLNIFYKKS
jgi:O-antigen/teichoic acid export membrane protein